MSTITFPGARCRWMPDPGEYRYTTIDYATPDHEPDKLGVVAHFENDDFGVYI